jgi:hypothetical protein
MRSHRSAGADRRLRRRPEVERAQRLGGTTSKWADEPPVVVVGDLAGPVVELELLERSQRAVTLLGQSEPALLELVRLQKSIVAGARLTQEGQGDEQHARNCEHGTDDESDGQMRTAASL